MNHSQGRESKDKTLKLSTAPNQTESRNLQFNPIINSNRRPSLGPEDSSSTISLNNNFTPRISLTPKNNYNQYDSRNNNMGGQQYFAKSGGRKLISAKHNESSKLKATASVAFQSSRSQHDAPQNSFHSKVDRLFQIVQKHDLMIATLNQNMANRNEEFTSLNNTIVIETIAKLKAQIIPQLLKNTQKEHTDQLLSIKADIQLLKKEKTTLFNQAEQLKEENRYRIEQISESISKQLADVKATSLAQQNKKVVEISEFNNWTYLIDKRLKEVEFLSKENSQKQIASIKEKLRASPILSTLPSTMVQYIELLRVSQNSKEIPITHIFYYVDREGYLLDKEKHYILNQINEKIQLEPRHMQILKSYNLLQ